MMTANNRFWHKVRQPYFLYLLGVATVGFLLVVGGLRALSQQSDLTTFFLILILAAASQVVSTSAPVSPRTGITFEVSTAVSLVAIPFYGPLSASVIVTFANIIIWLFKSDKTPLWKRSREQLAFNCGMSSIAIFVAGLVFQSVQQLFGSESIAGQTIPWLVAAIVNDQLNIWLLICILRLQHGPKISPLAIWQENRWAMPINIAIMSFGGGILAYAVHRFDEMGIIIFYLPIFLSAYAFRLYVSRMKTHLDNLEQIVAARTQELANLMKEKDAFLAVLTHDMKNPLATIGLYVDLIRQRPSLLQEKPHMTDIIHRSQATLLDIVNNILDLEKFQAGGTLSLNKTVADFEQIVEYAVETMRLQALDKRIDLGFERDMRPLFMPIDQHQIERVLHNIISNAIKYSTEQSCIRISLERSDACAILRIEDTGYGIPAEDLPFIFDRYRRVEKHTMRAAGTGLGLAIAKAIVEAHGGTISVSSQEGVGSTFTITLPLT